MHAERLEGHMNLCDIVKLLKSVYEAVLACVLEECGWNVKCMLLLTSIAYISTRGSSRLRVSQKLWGTRRREGW